MPNFQYVEGGVAEINAAIRAYVEQSLERTSDGDPPTLLSVQASRLGAYLLWSK